MGDPRLVNFQIEHASSSTTLQSGCRALSDVQKPALKGLGRVQLRSRTLPGAPPSHPGASWERPRTVLGAPRDAPGAPIQVPGHPEGPPSASEGVSEPAQGPILHAFTPFCACKTAETPLAEPCSVRTFPRAAACAKHIELANWPVPPFGSFPACVPSR